MSRQANWGFAAAVSALVMLMAGCQQKLAYERYQTIREGVSTKSEVEQTLGRPDRQFADMWNWVDHDRGITCNVYFDPRGVVTKKEWVDARRGIWEGSAAELEQGQAKPNSPGRTEQRTIIRTMEP